MINKKKLLPSNGICIIQGALLNFGRDINHNKDGFSPVKVILKNVKILEKLNIYIIISTWEPTETIEKNNLKKLRKALPKEIKIISLPKHKEFDMHNRYKQAYGASSIFHYLTQFDDKTPCFKVRTDMLYSHEIFEYCLKLSTDKYIVSEIQDVPYYLGDFIHYSKLINIKTFYSNAYKWGNKCWLHPATVCDLTIKNIIPNTGFIYLISKNIIGKYIICLAALTKWINYSEGFEALPKYLFYKMIWRDKPIKSILNKVNFISYHKKQKLDLFSFTRYIFHFSKNYFILYMQLIPKKII